MVPEIENALSLPLLFPKTLDCCEICGDAHKIENCTFFNANIEHVYDTPTPSYAQLTLPQGLEIREMVERETVFTTAPFAKGVQFGPFIAKTSNLMDIRIEFPLKVFLTEEDSVYLETYEEIFCNWMCFISPANNCEEQNLICYQIKNSIYFCTLRDIKEGEELRAWYAPYYAEKMGIPTFGKPSDMVHSSDDEYKDIFESLQNGNVGNHEEKNDCGLPKKRKRRKLSKRLEAAEIYLQPTQVNDLLPGELLGARDRKEEWHCRKCDQVEASVAAYARHLMSHYRVTTASRVSCPYCPRRFKKDGYNKEMHMSMCKAQYEKKQKAKGTSAMMSSADDVAVYLVPYKPDGQVSQEDGVLGSLPYQISSAQIIEDKTKPGEIYHSSCNILDDVNTSKTNNRVNGCSEEGNLLETNSNHLDFTNPNEPSLDFMRIKTQSTRAEVNSENGWRDVKERDSKSILKQETINTKKNNGTVREKLPEIIKNKIGPESLAENGPTKCHLNTPILDLSDDIDFNVTKSFVEIISEDCTLEKSVLYPKVNKGLDIGFDFAPALGIEPQVSSLESSTFYSQEKPSFLPSSFTGCDYVTDEEKDRIVENFLSDAQDKYHSTDYMATSDDCGAEHTDSNLNTDSENKTVGAEKGSRKRSSKNVGDFNCDICSKCFGTQKYLYRHLRKHTGEFRCNLCYTVFGRKETLINHRLNCAKEAPTQEAITRVRVPCKICKLQFHSLDSLKTHMATHYCKGDTWKCSCGIFSDNVDLLTNHPCSQARKVSCERCHEEFSSAKDFVDHKSKVINCRRRRHKDLSALCEYCGMVFKSVTGVRLHRAIHGDRKFECHICDKKFYRRDAMLRHRLFHDEPTWECSECLKKFPTKSSLQAHVKTMHQRKELTCTFCDKCFKGEGALKRHLKSHKSSVGFNCKHCEESFADGESLAKHKSKAHLSCSFCDKRFSGLSSLKRHMNTEHLVRYKCSFCDVIYRHQQSLKNHLIVKHKDRVEEWNSPDALVAMACSINESDNRRNSETSSTKDILQTAANIVMDIENIDEDGRDALPEGENEEADGETLTRPLSNDKDNPSMQLVSLNLESLSASGISQVIGPNAGEVFNVPLTYIENLQITDQIVTNGSSPSSDLPVNLNLDSAQGDSNLVINVDNAMINSLFNVIPGEYQLAVNDTSTEKQTTEDDPVLVDDLQDAGAFILCDGSIDQPNLVVENNVLFYVLDSPEPNILPKILIAKI